MNRSCLLLISALLLLLDGCGGVATRPPSQFPMPDSTPQGALPQQSVEQGGAAEPGPKPAMSGNPAVVALLDRAHIDSEAGRREAAGASLERALRIEPRNAWLWHELAQLRLAQGQYAQAITLAQKSISFAGSERGLRALDWRVIGNARVAQGNSAGAEEAFKRAAELEK